MAPTSERRITTPDGTNCREAATLLLLYPDAGPEGNGASGFGRWRFVLTLRPPTLRTHSGQIALPGGAVDPGETIDGAALREGEEEIGVARDRPRVLGRLTRLYIPPSGFCVTTVVAALPEKPDFIASPDEVVAILEPTLADLLDLEKRKRKTIDASSGIRLEAPYYDIGGHVVWGGDGDDAGRVRPTPRSASGRDGKLTREVVGGLPRRLGKVGAGRGVEDAAAGVDEDRATGVCGHHLGRAAALRAHARHQERRIGIQRAGPRRAAPRAWPRARSRACPATPRPHARPSRRCGAGAAARPPAGSGARGRSRWTWRRAQRRTGRRVRETAR